MLRTFPLELTSSDQTIFTTPPDAEGVANNILITGSGDVTLKYFSSRTGDTTTLLDAHAVSERFNFNQSLNLESGDRLIASGDGLMIFVSCYFVGDTLDGQLLFGPGPQEFVGGDMSAGFFGEVDSSELFTNNELDFLLGFTQGVQMPDAGWLKFARNGKILYVQKRPMRHSISWDHIYSRGAVYGVNGEGNFPRGTPTTQYRPLRKGNFTLVPRLLTGAASDPLEIPSATEDGRCQFDLGGGSEWNDLIYRIHQDEPSCSANFDTHGGPQEGSNWANYTDSDLGIGDGVGRGQTVQESVAGSTSEHVRRGQVGVSQLFTSPKSNSLSPRGLRLVLELES